jgi:hypothetical protein
MPEIAPTPTRQQWRIATPRTSKLTENHQPDVGMQEGHIGDHRIRQRRKALEAEPAKCSTFHQASPSGRSSPAGRKPQSTPPGHLDPDINRIDQSPPTAHDQPPTRSHKPAGVGPPTSSCTPARPSGVHIGRTDRRRPRSDRHPIHPPTTSRHTKSVTVTVIPRTRSTSAGSDSERAARASAPARWSKTPCPTASTCHRDPKPERSG